MISLIAERVLNLYGWLADQNNEQLLKMMDLTSEQMEEATKELLLAGLINHDGVKS